MPAWPPRPSGGLEQQLSTFPSQQQQSGETASELRPITDKRSTAFQQGVASVSPDHDGLSDHHRVGRFALGRSGLRQTAGLPGTTHAVGRGSRDWYVSRYGYCARHSVGAATLLGLEPKPRTILLAGLDSVSIAALMARTAGREPDPSLVAEVHCRTLAIHSLSTNGPSLDHRYRHRLDFAWHTRSSAAAARTTTCRLRR